MSITALRARLSGRWAWPLLLGLSALVLRLYQLGRNPLWLDELFEVATLIQTGKIKGFPIVLLGVDYWTPLLGFLRVPVLKDAAISQRDLDQLLVTDSPAEAVEFIKACVMGRFGLKYVRRQPKKMLFERSV